MKPGLGKQMWALECEGKWSSKNRQSYYVIHLQCANTGQMYRTYVSPDNRNYRKHGWESLVDILMNYNQAVLISANWRQAPKRPGVLNADCKFVCEHHEDAELMAGILDKKFGVQLSPDSDPGWRDFFE